MIYKKLFLIIPIVVVIAAILTSVLSLATYTIPIFAQSEVEEGANQTM
jgi:hypothetical protein